MKLQVTVRRAVQSPDKELDVKKPRVAMVAGPVMVLVIPFNGKGVSPCRPKQNEAGRAEMPHPDLPAPRACPLRGAAVGAATVTLKLGT